MLDLETVISLWQWIITTPVASDTEIGRDLYQSTLTYLEELKELKGE